MKAAAAAALLLAGPAHAQSSTVLYGTLDVFATRIDPGQRPAVSRLDSGALLASRLGVRGQEALGAGMAATYTLEAGISPDEGARADGSRLFNRQAWVGLAGPWGEWRLGRQNTPQFLMNGRFDAFTAGTQASGWNNMTSAPPRADAALAWLSPAWQGLRLQVLTGRGAMGGAAPLPQSADNRHLQLAAEYERGACYLGLNHQRLGAGALPTVRRSFAGGNCKLGERWQLFGAVGREHSSAAGVLDLHTWTLSALWRPSPAEAWSLGWTHAADQLAGPGHGDGTEQGLMYRRFLSLRTTLYATASRLRQEDKRSSFTLGGAGVLTAGSRPQAEPGGTLHAVQAGVLHQF